ncbi:MAG: AIR synthase-related protein [Deltaproteobacteria bacterium]|nr:AIR synthase-related protein [Deltaproteobacteria bacterium]
MPHRIEIFLKNMELDVLGEKLKRRIKRDLNIHIDRVFTSDIYNIGLELDKNSLYFVATEVFLDKVINDYSIDEIAFRDANYYLEVGLLPGVTDDVGRTAEESIAIALNINSDNSFKVFYSRGYAFYSDNITRGEVERVARDILSNELIQGFRILSRDEIEKSNGSISAWFPQVQIKRDIEVKSFKLSSMSDEELLELSKSRTLALTLEEMKTIRGYFNQVEVRRVRREANISEDITDVELECIAQTWSEHCKHKIFNALIEYEDLSTGQTEKIDSLFKSFIKKTTESVREEKGERDICVSVFSDNAGVIRFNERFNLVFKVETHNSPSALDPYGGALTGIVGVNRDPLGTGKGAKLIFNTDVFCFASPFYDKPLPPRILHPLRILEGVREGVEHGGNKSGIPTINGSVVFDDSFLGKPLVFCGTAGILPRVVCNDKGESKEIKEGDLIVMVGGRIGADGIHGATFSSEELHSGSPSTAVQIGDPITQKRMIDFLLVARDLCLFRTLTDNGAGGLSSSVGELAGLCGGAEIDLMKAPLKYQGLNPFEILISESQERMTVVVPQNTVNEFLSLSRKFRVESTIIGKFTKTGYFDIKYGDKRVGFLDLKFLHHGNKQMHLKAQWKRKNIVPCSFDKPMDLGSVLHKLLSSLNICSKHYFVRQYDHEVQGGSVLKPLVGHEDIGPSDAGIVRPDLDSFEGVVVSHGIVPRYSNQDTYSMAACAVDEAVRNFIAVGGDPDHMAGLDNFCWPDPIESPKNPDGRYKLAQLVRANKAVYDICTYYGIPLISGKDSMKNDYIWDEIKISVLPTLLFSVIGKINDVRKAVSMDFKGAGDLIYILGLTDMRMAFSEYFYLMNKEFETEVPLPHKEINRELYYRLHNLMELGLIRSCHDISDGGLAVALAESAFAGGFGADVEIKDVPVTVPMREDFILFSETPGRFVVTIAAEKKDQFENLMKGVPFAMLGFVNNSPNFLIKNNGSILVKEDINKLKESFLKTLDF